jgi:type II secretory pathway pseudopilin PulG
VRRSAAHQGVGRTRSGRCGAGSPPRARGGAGLGFTLVELVIVIGIIIILLALTIGVARIVQAQSEVRDTRNTLTLLESALDEWAAVSDRALTWGTDNLPIGAIYDVRPETTEVFTISELLDTLRKPASVQAILARIEPDFVRTYQGGMLFDWLTTAERSEMNNRWGVNHSPSPTVAASSSSLPPSLAILDAWERPIRAVHPGRVFNSAAAIGLPDSGVADEDGTIRTARENAYGIARGRKVYFVSSGPDGVFGNLHLVEEEEDLNQAQRDDVAAASDNIYSYEVGRERPTS